MYVLSYNSSNVHNIFNQGSTITLILKKVIQRSYIKNAHIQGLPSLNVATLHSCRGPQIKKNNVNFFSNSQFFLQNFLQNLEYF